MDLVHQALVTRHVERRRLHSQAEVRLPDCLSCAAVTAALALTTTTIALAAAALALATTAIALTAAAIALAAAALAFAAAPLALAAATIAFVTAAVDLTVDSGLWGGGCHVYHHGCIDGGRLRPCYLPVQADSTDRRG